MTKDKLNEISTDLMLISMKMNLWIDEIRKTQLSIASYRVTINGLINDVKAEDFE